MSSMTFTTQLRRLLYRSVMILAGTTLGFGLSAQPLLTESFNYAPGTLLTAANWTARASGTPTVTATLDNLAYANTIANTFGNKVQLTSSGQDVYRSFTGTSGNLYTSMIVNVSAAQATGDYFFLLGNATSPVTYGSRIYIRSNSSGFSFGVSRGNATVPEYETTVRPFDTEMMVVLKYEVVAGATNDIVKLYVNPVPLNVEPLAASVQYSAATGADINTTYTLSSVNLYQGTAINAATLQIDGIHVGDTWASLTTPQYDYGDVPEVYERTINNVYVPAVHKPIAGLRLGTMMPDAELAPHSVAAGADNNGLNGDDADEDALALPIDAVKQGLAYSLTVPVNSSSSGTKYLYAWIDFNNNGKFESNELTGTTLNFTTSGLVNRTLTWTGAQTGVIPVGIEKLYLRLRLSDRVLTDYTGATGGTTLDERSIGNGALSAASTADHATVAGGEVEDYQLDVLRLYDFGDAPLSYEYDKDSNQVPARHAQQAGLSIGTLVDIEAAPYSVAAGDNNNHDGDSEHDLEDEDGLAELPSVSKGVAYSLDVKLTAPTGTKYLYAWLDLNGDGRFQAGELTTSTLNFTTSGTAFTHTLTWSAAQTSSILPANTKNIYLRLRLSNTALNDFTTTTGGALGALIDERSIGNGATATNNATLAPTVAFGEVEDYQLRVDDYDFGDLPLTYENGVPARQIALPTRRIGDIVQYESVANTVPAGTDNNGANGDGEEEDGLTGTLPIITKGTPFSFSIPATVNVASSMIAWIDFNNDGKFQADEAAYTTATGTTTGYQAQAVGTNTRTFWFRGTQTNKIPVGVSNVYVRIRLTQTQGTDAATADIDERSIGDGASTGAYGTPSIGEIEDYRFAVVTDLDYGDAPLSYEENRDNNSRPARNFTTDNLFLGESYVLESGPTSVGDGNNNNAPNGDGDEEDGINASQLFVRMGGTNVFNVTLNNSSGSPAVLYAWIDFDNDGHFEANEFLNVAAGVTVANGATSTTITFNNNTTIPQLASKLYMRLRLVQANAEATIADFAGTGGTTVDERAIGDGLASGEYTSVAMGEVEDYQLTIIKDYGDAPLTYENSNPAFQSNTATPELYLGASVDYESAAQSVNPLDDNNGTNGDGVDEDAITQQQTITVGAPFSITVPVTSTSTGAKSIYAWIDFNGDGIFNGNEVATQITFSSVVGVTNVTLTWTAAQTNTTATAVIAAGKVYVRIRLSAIVLANSNAANLIDNRSFGLGNTAGTFSSGEIEDYQFLVSNLNDYGDAPNTFEANNAGVQVPARQAASNTLRLGLTVDNESTPASVSSGNDNNDTNGDGADEDGITNLAPIYSGIPYRTQVSVLNNTGIARTLHGWIDFNNDGRFALGEYMSVNVPSSPDQQTITLVWTAAPAISVSKVYIRLRITEGAVADNSGTTLVDERSISDGTNSGTSATLYPGEIEDYQLTVISQYDYGDAETASYDQNNAGNQLPARQAVSQGLYLGQLYPDAEASKQTSTNAQGDNENGANDEDGAVPGPITAGGGYTLNVNYTNNSGAARTLYGWIDFDNDGIFESTEAVFTTNNLLTNTSNGTVTLNWTTAQSSTIPSGVDSLYLRLRTSEGTLADAGATAVDERSIGDGLSTAVNATNPSNGEIEDYIIQVTTDLDYGDLPLSYEQPGGVLRPARQVSSAALQIGGTPDAEPNAQSVLSGADNNGINGDGADEDGIVPANHAVTVGNIFTLPVNVTNTSGTARVLYGWLDLNGNGAFDDGEVATTLPSVANGVTNVTVNLVWTAALTRNIQADKIYLRLRLADAVLTNNTATTYDERAFADGLTTGAYGTAATRGEIEDYQLAVVPIFDFGDVPLSYEQNNANVNVPARHQTLNTLYLGNTFGLETHAVSVAAGNDNNISNGDGADEDGIASLPVLYPGGSYSVPVNAFKSIAGTGTIHAWIDLNGDGRFSANEYSSATVLAATGAQSVNLVWPATIYTGAGGQTYMRLRFTTVTLSDNAATTAVDERSIGDGLSSGIYGTASVNGEVEDYQISIDNSGTPTIPVCEGLGSVDPIQAGFHATMVRPAAGGYLVFGEVAHGNGTSNLNTPVKLVSGGNGFNFSGDVLMATLGSASAFTYTQYFALTTSGLYVWGARGIVVPTAITAGTAMQPISLPPGISPARVKMIDAGSSYGTNNAVGDQTGMNGSLALLTTNGEVWIRSSVNAASITNDFNAVQGDGNLLANNSSTDWHQVQTSEGVPLTGMLDVRSTGTAVIATNGTQFYTWGRNVYSGNGSAMATQHYAIQMTTPTGFSGMAKKVDIGYGQNVSASYFILDQAGVVHVLGNNNFGQLGVGNTTAQNTWTQITTKNEEPDAPGNQPDVSSPIGIVTGISANNHDAAWGHFILITQDKRAYHVGSNAGGSSGGGLSGTVSPTSWHVPTAMTTASGAQMLPGKIAYGEAGGHIGVLAKEGSDRYGYVGHTVSGSDGCSGCTSSPSEYNFDKTTSTGPLCGIQAFDFGDLDDRYNLAGKARHEIKFAQIDNPLKLGSTAADSEEEPQVTANDDSNTADGDDGDDAGDDEDALTVPLPAKTAGQPYTLNVPLTNNTGADAYLYGFIDWNANGKFDPSETVTATVSPSATAQTIQLTWADPGFVATVCEGEMDYQRSFVRLRLTTDLLSDNLATAEDDRSHLIANDGEVEDYYLDWQPPFENFDYGNLPSVGATVNWPSASASLLSLDLTNTTRVWLGDDNSYPNIACESNVDRNGGFRVLKAGAPISGDGSSAAPLVMEIGSASNAMDFEVTVNGNGNVGVPVYWAIWFDANGNGNFTDAEDIFLTDVTTHGSPVTVVHPFTLVNSGTNTGALNGAIRLVATAVNTNFTKLQNGAVQVPNGEVEDYYVQYTNALPVNWLSFTAEQQKGTALLNWTVSSEQNNKGYEIQRSTNGKDWNSIGFVNSKAEGGNSSQKLRYEHTDVNPLPGANFYRIKQIDFDGRYGYSAVRILHFEDGKAITVAPNPTNSNVTISNLKGGENIALYDMTGREVLTTKSEGKNVNIDMSMLAEGVYNLRISAADGKVTVFKLVKS